MLVRDFEFTRVNGDWTAPSISQRAIAGRGQILSSFDSGGKSFFKNVNSYALETLDRWVPDLFGSRAEYQPGTGAYRISSKALGRNLQEDLSISPRGIKDWGVWDMGDPRMGKRTPIDLVLEFGARQNAKDAALWLCERTGVSAESLGWGRSSGAQQNAPAAPSIVPAQVADAPDPLREMNNEYCVLLDGGKSRVLTFERATRRVGGKVYVRHVPTFLAFQDFRNLHMNQRIRVGDENIPLGSWWLNQRDRRQYAGVVFDPCGPGVVDDRLNLWRGWGVEPKPGDWSKMREHIKHVLANGDTAADTYIINWLAWLVQYPAERAEVVLVFRGKRGTGKGTLGNCLMRLFGQHAVHISSADHLVGRFNAHLRDACFLFADEAYWPGDKRAEGALKRLITEEQLLIEAKGRDGTSVPNMLHVLMASNEDWIVPAGEHERRFAVFEVSERHLQDEKWFDPIYQQLENGGHAAMLHDLLQHKLGNWHPRRFPRTAGLLDQQKQSLAPFDAWWVELLETGELEGADPEAPCRAVSNGYDEEITDGNYTRTAKRRGLYDQARSIEPRLRGRSDHVLGHYLVGQGCKSDRVLRRRGWGFPVLSECRKAWEKRFPGWEWREERTEWSAKQEDDRLGQEECRLGLESGTQK